MSCNSPFFRVQSGLLNSSQESSTALQACSGISTFHRGTGQLSGKQENMHYGRFLPHSFLTTVIFEVLKLRIYYERCFLLQEVLFLCDNFISHWLFEPMFNFLEVPSLWNLTQDCKCKLTERTGRMRTKPKYNNNICEEEVDGQGLGAQGTHYHVLLIYF